MSRDQSERRSEQTAAAPAPRRRAPVRLLLSLSAAALMLALVVWLADPGELWRRLRGADLTLLTLSAGVYFLTYLSRARRFAAAGAHASTWTLLWVVAVHGALNRVMPLRTGELAYPLLARRVGAAATGEGLVQLLMLRLLDLITITLMFLVALGVSLVGGLAGLGGSSSGSAAAAALLAGIALVALWRLGWFLGLGLAVVKKLAAAAGADASAKVAGVLDRADEAVAGVTDLTLGQRLRLGGWSIACWGSYFVLFHLILLALDVPLPLLQTVLGSSAAIVGSVVPVSGIGTFGALEGGWTAGFVAVGLDTVTAASTALVMSGLTLTFALVLGALGWLVLGAADDGAMGTSEAEPRDER